MAGENHSEEFSSFPSELGDFAPWREEFPTPSAFSFQIICSAVQSPSPASQKSLKTQEFKVKFRLINL